VVSDLFLGSQKSSRNPHTVYGSARYYTEYRGTFTAAQHSTYRATLIHYINT